MFLLRRTAFLAVSTGSRASAPKSRSFVTQASPLFRATLQARSQSSVQRRFASDDIKPSRTDEDVAAHHEGASKNSAESHASSSADADDQSSLMDAISSAASQTSSASSYVAESVSSGAAAAASAVGMGGSDSTSMFERGGASADGASGARPNKAVYLGNLYFSVTEEEITSTFSEYGEILNVKIVYDRRGLSRGIAFVTYGKESEAESAVKAMHGQPFEGRTLVAQFAARNIAEPTGLKTVNNPSRTLFIGNMSFDMSDKDLNDLFLEVENCTDVRIAMDRRTGLPRGFAHADFTDKESAMKAREYLNGKRVYGRDLRIDFSRPTNRDSRARIDPSAASEDYNSV